MADRPTTGTWSAPGRVNLIGEHTDYTGGWAMPFALDRRTTVRATARTDAIVEVTSAGHGSQHFGVDTSPGEVDGWAAYVAGVTWATREAGVEVAGATLEVSSDVPPGSGLSSSHSLEVAVALALSGLFDGPEDLAELARLVQRAENDYVGAPTGVMDQLASLHGREGHVVLLDTLDLSARHLPCDLAGAGLALLVVDTRTPHALVDGEYAERRRTCHEAERSLGVDHLGRVSDLEAAMAALDDDVARRRVRHVVTENARVHDVVTLLEAGQLAGIGPVLTASHASLRDDYEVSAPRPDATVEAALAAGALGARIVGGGFGGSVVALVEAGGLAAVEDAVRARYLAEHWEQPQLLTAKPARGAGRDA